MHGISLVILVGPNGIITKANEAKRLTEIANAKEKLDTEIYGSFDTNGELRLDLLKENVKHVGQVVNEDTEDFPLKVEVDGYEFEITSEGNVKDNNIGSGNIGGNTNGSGVTIEEIIEYVENAKEEMNAEIENKIKEAKLELYPVGSIYISTTNENPDSYLGGTWEQYAQGRTLIGAGTGKDSNGTEMQFESESQGGEYSHKLTVAELASHTHVQNAHSHPFSTSYTNKVLTGHFWNFAIQGKTQNSSYQGVFSAYNSNEGVGYAVNTVNNTRDGIAFDGTHEHSGTTNGVAATNQNAGGDELHNNIQPYIVTYIWRRTQ